MTNQNLTFAKHNNVLIEDCTENDMKVVITPTTELSTLIELRRHFRLPIQFRDLSENEFAERLSSAYQMQQKSSMQMIESMTLNEAAIDLLASEEILDTHNEAPIIQLINATLAEAIQRNASDVHIQTFEKKLVFRFRIDGILHPILELERTLAAHIIARIKVMAKLDIAEKRLPQDGRISLTVAGRPVDVRVSIIPSTFNERVVMRLLDKEATRLSIDELGLEKTNLAKIRSLIKSSYGIILLTGPTGSGKTTTLYAMLNEINNEDVNILTIEDPIEYRIKGISQMQVNEKIEMTFAKGLRAILRQDPDVIMIGEIRDPETAEIAVQASLTGHLVFSTLHTNTAIDAVARLVDIGVEPHLLCSSLIGIMAQRLVRRLCMECRRKVVIDDEIRQLISESKNDFIYEAVGCKKCNNTGYAGRCSIVELLIINDEIKHLIREPGKEQELRNYLNKHVLSIQQDGMRLVKKGITTVEEVLRVLHKV